MLRITMDTPNERSLLAHTTETSVAYAEQYLRKMLKREGKAQRRRITETLEAVGYSPATKKRARVAELTKTANNPTHPRRQKALDELGATVGKGRFVRAATKRV